MLAANPAAHALFGARAAKALASPAPRALCKLVGCRAPEGPLADFCLHERAAERDGALPEIRLDLPEGSGAASAWVTVSRMVGTPDVLINEMRPGMAGDRRRRSAPHWIAGPQLRIITLGRTRLIGREGPMDGRWLSNRPGKILKLLLAQRRRGTVFVDEIAERLWPGATSAGAATGHEGLRYFIHALRGHLEPGPRERGKSAFIIANPGGYALNSVTIEVDADEFEAHVTAGLAAVRAGDAETAIARLGAGVALYGGDFLADEPYAEWALEERDRLHNLVADALRALARLKQEAGLLDEASADLERLTELEPFDVDAHGDLLTLLVRRGRRSEAVRRYTALRHRMLTTFEEDLEHSLAELTSR